MDENLTMKSTSPDSILSELLSYDSTTNTRSTVPVSSTTSILPPLRSSFTMANISSIANVNEEQNFFLDDFNLERLPSISRW
ncbi:unnamed protein product [Rotaria magnacalcarata]|nr:unnamed protein product [Rotaria magnacalcarata]CAF5208941.1 unnamed protein product [Rotaria magnacalcarata]